MTKRKKFLGLFQRKGRAEVFRLFKPVQTKRERVMPGSFKKILIVGAGALLLWIAVSVLRGDERYLRKTSESLIKQALEPPPPQDRMILKRINKMVRHIHPDIQFRAELQGRFYENRSLSEARSFLFMWFKIKAKPSKAEVSGDLQVRILPAQPANEKGTAPDGPGGVGGDKPAVSKRAEVLFPLRFQYEEKTWECNMAWGWIKEEGRWLIKTAKLSSCSRTP